MGEIVVVYIVNFFNESYNIDVIDVLLFVGINWLEIEVKEEGVILLLEGKICVIMGILSMMGCFDVKLVL